jgi:hypothetical protein
MKKLTQVHRNHSTAATVPQIETRCNPRINGARSKRHPSSLDIEEPPLPKEKLTPEAFVKRGEMRRSKMDRPIEVPLMGIYCPDRSDAQLLDFISLVVADNAPALRRMVTHCYSGEARPYWHIHLEEAIIAAEAAARRARWYGLAAAPDHHAESSGQKRVPLLLELPGYSGAIAYDDATLLHHICNALYQWRAEIGLEVQTQLAGTRASEFKDAMMFAELVIDRNDGVREVEEADERGVATVLQQQAWINRKLSLIGKTVSTRA